MDSEPKPSADGARPSFGVGVAAARPPTDGACGGPRRCSAASPDGPPASAAGSGSRACAGGTSTRTDGSGVGAGVRAPADRLLAVAGRDEDPAAVSAADSPLGGEPSGPDWRRWSPAVAAGSRGGPRRPPTGLADDRAARWRHRGRHGDGAGCHRRPPAGPSGRHPARPRAAGRAAHLRRGAPAAGSGRPSPPAVRPLEVAGPTDGGLPPDLVALRRSLTWPGFIKTSPPSAGPRPAARRVRRRSRSTRAPERRHVRPRHPPVRLAAAGAERSVRQDHRRVAPDGRLSGSVAAGARPRRAAARERSGQDRVARERTSRRGRRRYIGLDGVHRRRAARRVGRRGRRRSRPVDRRYRRVARPRRSVSARAANQPRATASPTAACAPTPMPAGPSTSGARPTPRRARSPSVFEPGSPPVRRSLASADRRALQTSDRRAYRIPGTWSGTETRTATTASRRPPTAPMTVVRSTSPVQRTEATGGAGSRAGPAPTRVDRPAARPTVGIEAGPRTQRTEATQSGPAPRAGPAPTRVNALPPRRSPDRYGLPLSRDRSHTGGVAAPPARPPRCRVPGVAEVTERATRPRRPTLNPLTRRRWPPRAACGRRRARLPRRRSPSAASAHVQRTGPPVRSTASRQRRSGEPRPGLARTDRVDVPGRDDRRHARARRAVACLRRASAAGGDPSPSAGRGGRWCVSASVGGSARRRWRGRGRRARPVPRCRSGGASGLRGAAAPARPVSRRWAGGCVAGEALAVPGAWSASGLAVGAAGHGAATGARAAGSVAVSGVGAARRRWACGVVASPGSAWSSRPRDRCSAWPLSWPNPSCHSAWWRSGREARRGAFRPPVRRRVLARSTGTPGRLAVERCGRGGPGRRASAGPGPAVGAATRRHGRTAGRAGPSASWRYRPGRRRPPPTASDRRPGRRRRRCPSPAAGAEQRRWPSPPPAAVVLGTALVADRHRRRRPRGTGRGVARPRPPARRCVAPRATSPLAPRPSRVGVSRSDEIVAPDGRRTVVAGLHAPLERTPTRWDLADGETLPAHLGDRSPAPFDQRRPVRRRPGRRCGPLRSADLHGDLAGAAAWDGSRPDRRMVRIPPRLGRATSPADVFLEELRRHHYQPPRPLPVRYRPLATAIVGERRVHVSTNVASRRALQRVGKRAATTGDTIHLRRAGAAGRGARPRADPRRPPSPEPRFFADDRRGPEERQADEVARIMTRAPILPRTTAAGERAAADRRRRQRGRDRHVRRRTTSGGSITGDGSPAPSAAAARGGDRGTRRRPRSATADRRPPQAGGRRGTRPPPRPHRHDGPPRHHASDAPARRQARRPDCSASSTASSSCSRSASSPSSSGAAAASEEASRWHHARPAAEGLPRGRDGRPHRVHVQPGRVLLLPEQPLGVRPDPRQGDAVDALRRWRGRLVQPQPRVRHDGRRHRR